MTPNLRRGRASTDEGHTPTGRLPRAGMECRDGLARRGAVHSRPRVLARILAASLTAGAFAPAPAWAAEWAGVATSTSGAVVVWSRDRVVRSDDGEVYAVAACGKGTIDEVVVDDDGAYAVVFAAENDVPARIELYPRGRPVVTVQAEPRRIAAGGGQLALVRDGDIERLDWDGRKIAAVTVPPPCEECDGAVASGDIDLARDRTVRLTDTEINTCTSWDVLEWQRVLIAGPRATQAVSRTIHLPREDYAATWKIGAHGWLYGVSYGGRLVAVGGGKSRPVQGVTLLQRWPELTVEHNERVTIAAVDDVIWRLDGASARLLARAPATPLDLALDARSRPLALLEIGGEVQLQRFERARGWVRILLPT